MLSHRGEASPGAGAAQGTGSVASVSRQHSRLLLTGVLLGLLGVAASLAQPWAIGKLIEAAGRGTPMAPPAAALVGLFCAGALLSALQAYTIGRAGEDIVLDVRRLLVGRLLRADLTAFARQPQGDILTRTVTDTSLVRIALSQSLAQLIVSGATVVGGVVLMFLIDFWLMVITLSCLGTASIASVVLARRLRRVALENRDDTGAFAADVQRVLAALPTVKASRAESREAARIGGLAERTRRSGVRVSAYNALLMPSMNIGTQGALAVVVGVGMSWVARGEMDMASLTTFIMYLFQLVSPLVMFFMGVGQFVQGRAAVQRVDELARLPQEDPGPPPAALPARLPPDEPAIEFRDVRFGYRRGREAEPTRVLDGVSFRVPARGLTAVVGPSGAGKTTLFQLIERFHAADGGQVRLGGRDIGALPLDTVRTLVGYVQQDSATLRGTVRENLTYASPDADDAAVREAVELAGLTSVIARLPRGLDTELGDQGSGLSGGQRQRLCIARTLLQRPAVMLLDEATSNLDSDSERDFRAVLRQVSRRCAVIAIAHRISTVIDADGIVVLEEGRVRATGVHHELMAHDALYRRLAGSQLNAGPRPADHTLRLRPVTSEEYR
ncbi:ABC transporter ATP-binding protein [Streptomyces sp. NPDC102490]|uniref:ABC transporter ATP-binding protein n=1 Tax=Streptomyces sp. NPDC102490 TaxID=3366183 RepID=UPI00381EFC1B